MDADNVPSTPMSLLELNLDELMGLSIADARSRVEAAGGHLRAAAPNQPVTMDYRGDRVTVSVTDGRVVGVHGIG